MDQTQKPIKTELSENTDLSKQYQDILNQYSKELQSSEVKSDNVSPVDPAPVESPLPDSSPTNNPPPMEVDMPATEVLTEARPEPAPPMVDTPVTEVGPATIPTSNPVPPTPQNPPTSLPPMPSSLPPVVAGLTPSSTPPKNIFKYFFFVSLLVFLGIFGMIIYTVLNAAANPTRVVLTDDIPAQEPTVSDNDTAKFCETNDKKVPTGESFPAADGCNTCTCGDDLTISCTEMDCSTSSGTTPTEKVAFSVPKNWKTYTDKKYQYSYSCPPEYKQEITVTSVDGKTIPLKQERCISGDKFFQVEVWSKEWEADSSQSGDVRKTSDDSYQIKLTGADDTFLSEVSTSFKLN